MKTQASIFCYPIGSLAGFAGIATVVAQLYSLTHLIIPAEWKLECPSHPMVLQSRYESRLDQIHA